MKIDILIYQMQEMIFCLKLELEIFVDCETQMWMWIKMIVIYSLNWLATAFTTTANFGKNTQKSNLIVMQLIV